MTMRKLIAILALAASIAPANAASKKTCAGEWTDTRGAGAMIGQCSLNNTPNEQFETVKSVCGEPGTIDREGPPPVCHIEALVNGTSVTKVLKVTNPNPRRQP
jgi:hypothetical protein